MATYSKTELARDVLLSHGIAGAEDTIAAADRDYVVRTYDNLFAEWQHEDRVYWKIDAIPQALFETVKALVWNRVQNAFGKTQSPEDQDAREKVLMKRFYRHNAVGPSGYAVKADYF